MLQGLPDTVYWPAERLIQKGIATLREIQSWYSIDDVFDRVEALDAFERAQALADKQARDRAKVDP